jgi:hypothetical protein
MASDLTNSGHQAREEEIERLAQELGRLIQSAEPEKREDLKDLAFTLIREEIFQRGESDKKSDGTIRPFNPLGTGVLFFVLGAGMFFLFPGVGLTLMLGGVIFVVWGAIMSWFKR